MSARLLLLIFFGCISQFIYSQSCFTIYAGNDTTIPCSQNCLSLKARIPDIRSTTEYKVIPYSYNPFPYYIAGGTTVNIVTDDIWSPIINLPFNFCFFGINYNRLVVGSNGLLSFDISNTGSCPFIVSSSVPSSGYPRSCIMGPYHDINPADPAGAARDRSMQYAIVGSAPCRKFILNFYKIPLYGDPGPRSLSSYCRSLLVTHQIVLYEGTGVIDINIQDKPSCPDWQGGRAIVGIQNNARTVGVSPPNRNATLWGTTGMNESWRFVPSGGTSLLDKVELYNRNTLIGTGDTLSLGTGELQATFNNVCTSSDTSAYRVIATYKRCDDPASLITAEDTIQVFRPGGPQVTAGFTPASCASGGFGIIRVSSPIGANYRYSINNGATYQSSPVFNVPSSTYDVITKDTITGCTGSTSITVPTIETIRFATSVSNATCYGAANAQVLVITQAGAAPFQFSGDGGTSYQGSNLLQLAAGMHTIRVKDNNGCTRDTVVNVTQPDSITIAPLVNAAYCSGNPDGQVIITATGGTPTYRYSLTNTTYQNSDTLFANVGSYTVYVKDNNGCVYSKTGITVPLNDTMRLAPYPDTSVCIGSSITVVPNTNATAFTWSPNTFISDVASARPTLTPQDTITYYLQARLGTLCSRTDTFTVDVLKRPIPDAGPDTTICFGTQAYFHATAIRGNKFRWSPAANLSSSTIPNPVATGFVPINYIVEVTDLYNCGFKEYDTLRLTVRPKVRAFAGQDTTATIGTPVQLFGCCMDLYRWNPSSIFVNDTARNPIGNFPAGTTQVVMITTTPEGCEGRDTVLVTGYQGPTYYVPSAFSPGNQDGLNDIFRPVPVGITETYYFSVFNRFGQLLYTTKTFLAGWDGKWKGELQPGGAYVWMVKGKGIDGKIVQKRGTIVLIR